MPDVIPMFMESEHDDLTRVDIEQSLLGEMIFWPAVLERLPGTLSDAHFTHPWHQEIFRAIKAIAATGTVDLIALTQALRGGPVTNVYLADLTKAALAPASAPAHASAVIDLWRRREMVRISNDMAAKARAGSEYSDPTSAALIAMSELDALSLAAAQQQTMFGLAEAADEALARARDAAAGKVTGVTTGYRSLDAAMGNLEPGCLYILAGRPGMGKTALALGMALNMSKAGARVFYDSLEMQSAQLGRRAMALVSGVPHFVIKRGIYSEREFQAISRARASFSGLHLEIDQQAGINMAMVALKARTAKRKMGGLDAIFVDHMHIVAPESSDERNGATWAVKKVSNALKKLAVDMDVPVVALAQLNRGLEGKEDKRPGMSDLRQSGDIEQDADGIMFVYRGEYYLKSEPERTPLQSASAHQKALDDWHEAKSRLAGKAEIIIAKLREGEPGSVHMTFDGARTAFGDAE